MPVKTDDSGRRWVEMEFVVPGTPEQVWHAVATGPGMSAWFTPTTVEENVGGSITFDFGEGALSNGSVTAWAPPSRLVYEEYGWSEGAPPVVTEVVVTDRPARQQRWGHPPRAAQGDDPGNSPQDECVVRMTHSLLTARDDWDKELESFETGWPGFFAVLRVYLKNFAGQPAAVAHAMAARQSTVTEVWSRLTEALGLAGAGVGDRCQTPSSAPTLAGVVERVRQDGDTRELMLRMDKPAPGIAAFGGCLVGDQVMVALSVFFYGADATALAEAGTAQWAPWLTALVGE